MCQFVMPQHCLEIDWSLTVQMVVNVLMVWVQNFFVNVLQVKNTNFFLFLQMFMSVYQTARYFYYHKHYHLLMYKTIITYFCPWLGWEGKTCDENINECDGNPCLNGGMCMDTPGSFVCGCPFGKQTYLIYISIVNNNIVMILELQAVNLD